MFWVIFFFSLLPTIIWLTFFLQEDRAKPEPVSMLLRAFILGILVTLPVYLVQKFYNFVAINSTEQLYSLPSFIFLALTEEIAKFLMVFLFIRKSRFFDEPVDAMIYMIVVALGFATVENIISVFSSYNPHNFSFIEVSLLRIVGATLIHSFSSGLIGFHWGWALRSRKPIGMQIVYGLVLAILSHALFNFYIIRSIPLTIPLFLLIVIGLFIFRDFEILKRI